MAEIIQEAHLCESSSEDDVEGISNKRIKKVVKTYLMEQTFHNISDAEKFIENENNWAYAFVNKTQEGKKRYYRCSKVKKRGVQCEAAIYLLFDSMVDEILLFRSDNVHTHTDLPAAATAITTPVKNCIKELYDMKMMPNVIKSNLIAKQLEVPTDNKLNNYIKLLNQEKYGEATVSLGELEAWIISMKEIPDDEDEVFVANYLIDYSTGNFKFLITTKRLLKGALATKFVCCDATYKLMWQGFPVLLVGNTDNGRHFHSIALVVASNEKTEDFCFMFETIKKSISSIFSVEYKPEFLMSDAAPAIHNGFKQVFENTTILMCWAHVKMNVSKKLSLLTKGKFKTEIMADFNLIQLSQSADIFNKSVTLFCEKWKKQVAFLNYINQEWLSKNRNWYEGASGQMPSTNNALESSNRSIKDKHTLRERQSLSKFKIVAVEMVTSWSVTYKNKQKVFQQRPTIDLPLWTKAYQWAKLNKKLAITEKDDLTIYNFAAKETIELGEIKTYEEWISFDEFKDYGFNNWKVEMKKNEWANGKCNCPAFFKKYICKHTVGLAIRLKFIKPPPEAKSIKIDQKRKRGRPSKAKKALIVQ